MFASLNNSRSLSTPHPPSRRFSVGPRRRVVGLGGVCVLLLCAGEGFAQRDLTDIPAPDVAKELAALQVPEGFSVNLFAADPDIAKPIQTNWDARGRLWVATSSVYPQLEPGEVADDKIVILEDTDGDGASDERTVFADGLLIPTGVLPDADGRGAYVANSTELLYMKDTDGDGVADERTVVLDGFGTEDTHHIIHTLRRGPDGAVYFNQSIYIHSQIETPRGLERLDGGGVWRYRPERGELEVWTRGLVNPWGHRFDRWGQQFLTDGAGGNGINYAFPGAAYQTAVDVAELLPGLNPGQPKHCGLAILDGRHLGGESAIGGLDGRLVTADFRGHRVNTFAVSGSGSGFVSRQGGDLLWSGHVAFRPIDAHVGPDGAVYVADWYNPIIQHGEVDFRDPRRDKTHGRIWRVTREDRPTLPKPDLAGADTADLLDALAAPESWTRGMARRLLADRGTDAVLPELTAWVARLPDDATHERLEALWLAQSLGEPTVGPLGELLGSGDFHARAAAVRVLGEDVVTRLSKSSGRRGASAHEPLAPFATDPHPRVRLEAVNALRRLGTAEAARAALAAVDQPTDLFLGYALRLTARELADEWLPRLEEDPGFFGDPERLLFALSAAGRPEALRPALTLWDAGDLDADAVRRVIELVGRFGGADDAARLLSDAVLDDDALRGPALSALRTAAERGVFREEPPAYGEMELVSDDAVKDEPDAAEPVPWAKAAGLLRIVRAGTDDDRAAAARILGRWRVPDAVPVLADIAAADDTPAALRTAAAAGLADLAYTKGWTDGESATRLGDLMTGEHPRTVRIAATVATAGRWPELAAESAADLLVTAGDDFDPSALLAPFLAAKNGPARLAAALREAAKESAVPGPVAVAALRRVSQSPGNTGALAAALRETGGVEPVTAELGEKEFADLVARVRDTGDPARGEAIYHRTALQCTKCHAIGGAGGVIGPDLTSIGGSAQVDYLVESLLWPERKIKEGYHTSTVLRDDGTTVTGVVTAEAPASLTLRDADGREIVIPTDAVLDRSVAPVSLMPAGLTKSLRPDEFADLTAFLSQLGRGDGFRVEPRTVLRTWRVLGDEQPWGELSRTMRANGMGHAAQRPDALPWSDVYSRVSGDLPLADLPRIGYFGGQKYVVLQSPLVRDAAGPATLTFDDPAGVSVWHAGQRYDLDALMSENTEGPPALTLDFPAGETVLTFAVDADVHGDALRVEVE